MKKRAKKSMLVEIKPDQPKGRYVEKSLWTTLRVEDVLKDEHLRHVVKLHTRALVGWPWPKRTRGKIVRPKVKAEIRLSYPFTKRVPAKLKIKTATVSRLGEVLIIAAEMYERIYQEDERLGGETTEKRDARLKKEKKPRPIIVNRDEGPYIWGHDIGDLFFEQLSVRWLNPTACVVDVWVGS